MTEYIPKKYPVYTMDGKGNIREYWGVDAWCSMRKLDERRIWKKDLPKDFTVHEEWHDIDV